MSAPPGPSGRFEPSQVGRSILYCELFAGRSLYKDSLRLPRIGPMSLRSAGLEAHLFPSRACTDATPVIAPRHPLPRRGNSPGTHYRGCDPAKTSPVRARPLIPAEAEIPSHIWEWRHGCLRREVHKSLTIRAKEKGGPAYIGRASFGNSK